MSLIIVGFAASALAKAPKPDHPTKPQHVEQAPKAKPGVPGDRVRQDKIDDELSRRINRQVGGETVDLIVTLEPGQDLPAHFKRYVHRHKLNIINGYALDGMPVSELPTLARHVSIHRLHYSRSVHKHDALSSFALHANAVDPDHGINQQLYPYTGSGIRVAVIDSGFTPFPNSDVADNRVKFLDFVDHDDEGRKDFSGHGTAVAGIIAGTGADNIKYAGTAPGTKILSMKVLDANGWGSIADVIEAMDWIYRHPAADVRVVNMSVGASVSESYWTDPLTLAAKALVDRGITVVAAAGNLGKNSQGQLQWGGVTAPGIAPWVLTVCAFSTNGTYDLTDDKVADFSSAGPTWLDFNAKPDICAPGVGIVSLAALGSTLYNLGALQTPSWLVGGTAAYSPYESLTGTSMAAPFVSGTVALMLQANPNLTPNLIKAILEYTASFKAGVSPLRQGAGFMNTLSAVELARFYANAQPGATLPIDEAWSRHIIWGNHMLSGGIIDPNANAWVPGVEWGYAKTQGDEGDNIVWGTTADGDSVVWGTIFEGDNIVWGTVDGADNIVWGTDCGGADCDNVVWGTIDPGDNIVWGTAEAGDNIVWGTDDGGDNIVWGTAAAENVVWDLYGKGGM